MTPDRQRVLAAVYLLFAIAATARSATQLATHAGRAPLAYGLSALAAAIYCAGAVAVRRRSPGTRTWLRRIAVVELTGVLGVGLLSVLEPRLFPDSTVWSQFGLGYALVPLALPVAVLALTAAPKLDPPGATPRLSGAAEDVTPDVPC